jgi:hypothetical protein
MGTMRRIVATLGLALVGAGVLAANASSADAAVWNQSAGPLWCNREAAEGYGGYGSLLGRYGNTVTSAQLPMVHANSDGWVSATVRYYFYDANWRWTGQSANGGTLYKPPNHTSSGSIWGYFARDGLWVFTGGQKFAVSGRFTGPNVLAVVSYYDYGTNTGSRWSTATTWCS